VRPIRLEASATDGFGHHHPIVRLASRHCQMPRRDAIRRAGPCSTVGSDLPTAGQRDRTAQANTRSLDLVPSWLDREVP
jgi:hypothetical protein